MKLFTTCPLCLTESPTEYNAGIGNLEESGLIRFMCDKGHETIMNVQEFKFEILFYQAIKHYTNAEYETSLMLFANSLERFYEFFIKLYARKFSNNNTYVDNHLIKSIDRSEQQSGAFKLLYFLVFNETPPTLSGKLIELRNNVVHNGQIIKQEDCYKYANAVLDILKNTVQKIKEKDEKIILEEVSMKMLYQVTEIQKLGFQPLGAQQTFISFTLCDVSSYTIDGLIEHVSQFEAATSQNSINQRKEALKIQHLKENTLLKQIQEIMLIDNEKIKCGFSLDDVVEVIKIVRYHLHQNEPKLIENFIVEVLINKSTKKYISVTTLNTHISHMNITEISEHFLNKK